MTVLRARFFLLLPRSSLPEAAARFLRFDLLQDCGQVGVRSGASFLRQRAVVIKLPAVERLVFSESRQTSNDLIEAGVDLQQMPVD